MSTKAAVYNRNVLLLLASVFMNTLGMGIVQMYALIYIYSVTNSNFYAALEGAVAFGSGVVASYLYLLYKKDRFLDRYMLRGEVACFLVILIIAWVRTVPLVYASLVVIYIANGFFKPSYQTVLYSVVNPKHIVSVNATLSILCNIAYVFGWLFAPLCFGIIDYRGLFLFVAVFHLVSGCFILAMRSRMKKQGVVLGGKSDQLASSQNCNGGDGLSGVPSFERYKVLLGILFLISSVAIIRAAIDGLEMGVFRTTYYLSDMLIGIFFIVWMFGGIIAGMVNRVCLKRFFKGGWLLRTNVLIFIVGAFAFAYFKNKYVGLIIYSVCGFLYFFADIFSNAYIYQRTAKEKHARNFGLKNIVFNGAMLICLPVLGYIADIASILTAMIIAVGFASLIVVLEVFGLNSFVIKSIIAKGVDYETTS